MCFGITFLSSVRTSDSNFCTGKFAKLLLFKCKRNTFIFSIFGYFGHPNEQCSLWVRNKVGDPFGPVTSLETPLGLQ